MIQHLASSFFSKTLYTLVVSSYFIVLFSSCNKSNQGSISSYQKSNTATNKISKGNITNISFAGKTSPYSGEEIFKGIAFNIGRAANLVPSLSIDVYKDTVQTSELLVLC